MDEDMIMNDNKPVSNKKQSSLPPINMGKKLSKREIGERMRQRMNKKVTELRKQKNFENERKILLEAKKANTADLCWFIKPLNEIYKENGNNDIKIDDNINNYDRLNKLRIEFTHPLARFDDGELKQEYYNDTKPAPSIVEWTDLELIQLYKGMEKYGFSEINCWMKISENMVPTRNFGDIKMKISLLLGIQDLSIYSKKATKNISELWISREFEKNKKEGISKNRWKNGIYMNKQLLTDNILNKEYIDKKIKEFNKKNKGFIEYRNGEYEDYDGSIYYFNDVQMKELIPKSDLYGYKTNEIDLKRFDFESSDDGDDDIIDDDNESDYSQSIEFIEDNYNIIDSNIDNNIEKKEESI